MRTKLNRILVLLFFCLTFAVQARQGNEISGTVSAIIDGNTIEFISVEKETYVLVLSGIDCPEIGQEFASEAKELLTKIVGGKEVFIVIEGKDRLGNKVGTLKFKGRDPRLDLLARGLAWTVEKDPNPSFEELRKIAQESAKGLWKQENPTPPWTYRREQSMLTAKSN
jgi:micrococcal nuclease